MDHLVAPEIQEDDKHEHDATVDDADAGTKLKEKEATEHLKLIEMERYKETAMFPHLLVKLKKDSKT